MWLRLVVLYNNLIRSEIARRIIHTKLYSFRFDCKIVSLTAAKTNRIFSVSWSRKWMEWKCTILISGVKYARREWEVMIDEKINKHRNMLIVEWFIRIKVIVIDMQSSICQGKKYFPLNYTFLNKFDRGEYFLPPAIDR